MANPRFGLSLPCATRYRLGHGKIAFVPGAFCLPPGLPGRLKVATIGDRNVDSVGEKDTAAGLLQPAQGIVRLQTLAVTLCHRQPGRISIATRGVPTVRAENGDHRQPERVG